MRVAAALVLFLGAAPLACTPPCQGLETVSETSHGSFAYTAASSGAPATVSGDLSSGEIDVWATASSTVKVMGDIYDSNGNLHPFTLTIDGVTSGASTALGSGSAACLDGALLGDASTGGCTPLVGNVDASVFSTDCQSEGCSLVMAGTLTAETTWSSGSFRVSFSLQHQDAWHDVACQTGAPLQQTPGS